VQPFCAAHPFTQPPNPMLCISVGTSALPSNAWFPGSRRLNIPNGILTSSTVYAQVKPEGSLYTLQWAAFFPLKIAPSHGSYMDPHLIHGSLGPPEPTTQTVSRSVQAFCRVHYTVTDRQIDQQTDRPRYSVGNNYRPHLRCDAA